MTGDKFSWYSVRDRWRRRFDYLNAGELPVRKIVLIDVLKDEVRLQLQQEAKSRRGSEIANDSKNP